MNHSFFHINERNCLISRLFSSSTPICTLYLLYIHIHFDKCTFLECLTTTYLSYQKRINLTFGSTQKIQNYVVEHNLTNIHIYFIFIQIIFHYYVFLFSMFQITFSMAPIYFGEWSTRRRGFVRSWMLHFDVVRYVITRLPFNIVL